MSRLDAAIRNIVIGRLAASESQNAVATPYNVHRNTIARLWQRYQQSGSTNDRPRSGHPRITSHVQDRYIRVFQLRNRTEIVSNTPGLRRISAKTVRNRLPEHGIRARRSYFSADLQRQYRRARVRWCHDVDVDNHGVGSVMVWGAIYYARKTQLVPIQGNLNAARYGDEILQPHLLLAIDVRREFSSRTMPDHILHS
jgi:transposase